MVLEDSDRAKQILLGFEFIQKDLVNAVRAGEHARKELEKPAKRKVNAEEWTG